MYRSRRGIYIRVVIIFVFVISAIRKLAIYITLSRFYIVDVIDSVIGSLLITIGRS